MKRAKMFSVEAPAQLRWAGHVMRIFNKMGDERHPKTVFSSKRRASVGGEGHRWEEKGIGGRTTVPVQTRS